MIYFGLSEETGMKDIEYFCKTQQIPDLCLVTDTNFPICYGEKGLLRAELNFQTEGNLVDFHAGSVVNVIPSKAEVLLSGVSLGMVLYQTGVANWIALGLLGNLGGLSPSFQACGIPGGRRERGSGFDSSAVWHHPASWQLC